VVALLNRWWFHIWRLSTWKAVVYLLLVAVRALMVGGGMMFLLSDADHATCNHSSNRRCSMSVLTGILGLRVRLGRIGDEQRSIETAQHVARHKHRSD
jgi:hypothetical protein